MTIPGPRWVGAIIIVLIAFGVSVASAQDPQDPQVIKNRLLAAERQIERTNRMRLELEQKKLIPISDKRASVSGLSAVLVAGSLQASTTSAPDDVPAPARKALADMKDFLPYKGYQLLDAAWLRGTGAGGGGTLRLKGAEGQIYQLDLTGLDATLSVGVRLSENGPARSASSIATLSETVEFLKKQRAQLQAERHELSQKYVEQHPRMLESSARLADIERQLANAQAEEAARMRQDAGQSELRTLMNTRFQMEVGETVVVGTSRVTGDKALILLLTAVGK